MHERNGSWKEESIYSSQFMEQAKIIDVYERFMRDSLTPRQKSKLEEELRNC